MEVAHPRNKVVDNVSANVQLEHSRIGWNREKGFLRQRRCDSLSQPQDVGGGDGMAAGAELLGGPTGAGSGGNRRWHGGAAGGVGISGQRVLHLQGADPATANRRGERQLPARPPAAQTDAGTRSRRGGAYRDPSGHHPGGAANLAGGRARGAVEQRGDVVGGRPPRAVV